MTGPNVMIVEDEMLVALQLEEKLPRMGYNVIASVTSGEEAVEKAYDLQLDLIIMDIRLDGELDGIEAAGRIRGRHNIPVIYFTAHSDDTTLRRAKLTSPAGYLVKPFSETDLRTAVDTALYKYGRIKEVEEAVGLVSSPLDNLGGAVIVTGDDGTIRYMNSVAERLTAWRHENAAGRNLIEVYVLKDPETGSMVNSDVSMLLRPGYASAPSESLLVSQDLTETHIEPSVIPVNDAKGRLSQVIIAFQKRHRKDERKFGVVRLRIQAISRGRAELLRRRLCQGGVFLPTSTAHSRDEPRFRSSQGCPRARVFNRG